METNVTNYIRSERLCPLSLPTHGSEEGLTVFRTLTLGKNQAFKFISTPIYMEPATVSMIKLQNLTSHVPGCQATDSREWTQQ